jgi:hypothetical protein
LELQPLELATLRSRVALIAPVEREMIASLLVKLAAIGGVRHTSEIAVLERIYRQLDLDPEHLYAGLHRTVDGGAASDDPIPVSHQEPARGFSIPEGSEKRAPARVGEAAPRSQERSTPQPDRLEAIRAETRAVTAVLTKVFEEPEDKLAKEQTSTQMGESAGQLRPRHLRLLHQVLLRDTWPRREFEGLARELGLMPGAAIEELNAWAYDVYDDVLLEDGDPVNVNRDIMVEQFCEAAE